jgi:cell division protein FtsZ
MEYVYAGLILNEAKTEITKQTLTRTLESAGVDVDSSRVRALLRALEDVDIQDAIKQVSSDSTVEAIQPPKSIPDSPNETMVDEQVPDLDSIRSPPQQSVDYAQLNLDTPIGSGGQGVVYMSSLPEAGSVSHIAVKEPAADSRTIDPRPFLKEAETWETVDRREREKPRWERYEHIVGVIDTGDDLPWIAMEYMDGGSLADRLDANPDGLPIEEALWIGECICRGVEIAHNYGIAHLDLKPANVLFRETPDGMWDVPKISDWGLSRVLAEQSGTADGLSINYAAPEQFEPDEFGDPDMLTDVYQVGAVVYKLLTGKAPFTGSQSSVMYDIVHGDVPTSPGAIRSDVPDIADTAVLLALNREKTDRYRNIETFEQALRAIRTDASLPAILKQEISEPKLPTSQHIDASTDQQRAGNNTKPDSVDNDLTTTGTTTRRDLDITIIGCGGAGCNIITRAEKQGIGGENDAELVAVDTDAQHLASETTADTKLLIGKERTGGRGAGSVPEIGKEAAQEDIADIRQVMSGSDIVFIAAGFGGGTGTGATPVIAEAAQEVGVLTVPFVTTPFSAEGEKRQNNATDGVNELRSVSDTVFVVPDDQLWHKAPDLPLQDIYQTCGHEVINGIYGVLHTVATADNYDEVTSIIDNGGICMATLGESDSENMIRDAIVGAMRSPFLDVEAGDSRPALMSIRCSPTVSSQDVTMAVKDVVDTDDGTERTVWNVDTTDKFEHRSEVVCIFTHISDPQLYSQNSSKQDIDFDHSNE